MMGHDVVVSRCAHDGFCSLLRAHACFDKTIQTCGRLTIPNSRCHGKTFIRLCVTTVLNCPVRLHPRNAKILHSRRLPTTVPKPPPDVLMQYARDSGSVNTPSASRFSDFVSVVCQKMAAQKFVASRFADYLQKFLMGVFVFSRLTWC